MNSGLRFNLEDNYYFKRHKSSALDIRYEFEIVKLPIAGQSFQNLIITLISLEIQHKRFPHHNQIKKLISKREELAFLH